MRKSEMDSLMWPFYINGNANFSNLWPELCQNNESRYSGRKKDSINAEENSRTVILDSSEYPELGCNILSRNRNSLVPRGHSFTSPSVEILFPMQNNQEPRKSRSLKRYKRSDRICINLREAIESSMCTNRVNGKELPKFKISIYGRNLGMAVPNIIDKSRQSDFRKVRICISKDKKPSRLKKIILVNRDMKARINIQRREAFEQAKMEAFCRDVNTIDFNTLKITSDPEIESDYVKNLCTLSLYDKNFRNTHEMNISDNVVSHRPDVIDKIDKLKIERRQSANRSIEYGGRADVAELYTDDLIEDDIVNQTLSLRIEEDVKPDIGNIAELDNKDFVKFSQNFREYCTNLSTTSLNESLKTFLQEVTRLQKRYHEKNPNKSRYKRRYYSGLKEVRKHVELKKIKFVIIAPDIEKVEIEGGLDDEVTKLISTCRKQNVVFCFGLKRRKLGYYTHGNGFVGCVGVANYSGTEPLFKTVLIELVHARNEFKKQNGSARTIIEISKVLSEGNFLSEEINELLNALSRDTQCS